LREARRYALTLPEDHAARITLQSALAAIDELRSAGKLVRLRPKPRIQIYGEDFSARPPGKAATYVMSLRYSLQIARLAHAFGHGIYSMLIDSVDAIKA